MPEGATIVYSAHGVAPSVHANSGELRPQRHRRDVPARDQGARPGEALRGRRLHGRPHRPRRPRGGRRDDGRGARLDRPRRVGRGRRGARVRAGARLAYITQTTLSVDETREIIAALRPPLPGHPRAEEGGHLLRDLQPAVGGQGDARRDRPPARDRLAELVELEPARRRVARQRRRVVPHRRRDRDRPGLARRRPRPSASPRGPRRRRSSSRASATGSAPAASSGSSRTRWSTRT